MFNKKKEGGFYASKVRLFLNEYDGISLEKILHAHRFTHPVFLDEGKHVYHISWSSFVYLLKFL